MPRISPPRWSRLAAAAIAIAIGLTDAAEAAAIAVSASGPAPSDIQSTVDAYRTSLGSLNPNVAGSFGSGRREINWDGVSDSLAAPNNLPANFFNVNSPRGVIFSTAGTGFQVSANSGVAPIEFGNINPLYPSVFQPFSAQRLFTALGSNIIDVNFFVPGTTTADLVSGFGAVFSHVDLANTTSIQYFDRNNNSLGTFFVPSTTGNETFSFLGVQFSEGSVVARVRITSGNQVLGAGSNITGLTVMDDFIFGEPAAVPAPASLVLFGTSTVGLLGLARWLRRGRAV